MDVYRNSCMRSKAHNSLAGGVAHAHNPFATLTTLKVVNVTKRGDYLCVYFAWRRWR